MQKIGSTYCNQKVIFHYLINRVFKIFKYSRVYLNLNLLKLQYLQECTSTVYCTDYTVDIARSTLQFYKSMIIIRSFKYFYLFI